MIKINAEIFEVDHVLGHLVGDDFAFRNAGFAGGQHGGRAVRVGATDVADLMPAQALETHPDVGLNVFN